MSEGANDERIDIINEIDWSTKDAVLKAEFPMNVKNQEAVYDLGIGTVKRKNNTDIAYEVYAQQWADITSPDKSYGISILNDCKYGWDKPNDNTLRLTLLHAPRPKTDINTRSSKTLVIIPSLIQSSVIRTKHCRPESVIWQSL